jgi:mannose-6-phosphate isomerase-like protein (cupin superfamily)
MFIRNLRQCPEFIAGDGSILKELLHPDKADLRIGYSLARAAVKPGQITVAHRLKTSEVYYILKGKGIMYINGRSRRVISGCAVYIPPGARQYIKNTGRQSLIFLCIVDPAWRKENEKVFI